MELVSDACEALTAVVINQLITAVPVARYLCAGFVLHFIEEANADAALHGNSSFVFRFIIHQKTELCKSFTG